MVSAAGVAACSAPRPGGSTVDPSAASTRSASSTPSIAAPTPGPTSSVPPALLPATHAWVARRGEVEPAVKRRATDLVESVAAWTAHRGGLADARARATAAGHDPGLADQMAPLLGSGLAAAVQVRDAQYGGILSGSASVLVVVDQWRAQDDGTVTAGGTTLDVRLVAASPQWRVVAVHPASPGRAVTSLSSLARRVLADDRVRLPYAAHADVAAGTIHDTVLSLLVSLAPEHVVDVSVLRSGHPQRVFGTSRTSDHPRGRAVDVWALDSRPLVVPANHGLAVSAMRHAVAQGAYNVGGPVLLAGSPYFSDRTHQDHIHLGFDR